MLPDTIDIIAPINGQPYEYRLQRIEDGEYAVFYSGVATPQSGFKHGGMGWYQHSGRLLPRSVLDILLAKLNSYEPDEIDTQFEFSLLYAGEIVSCKVQTIADGQELLERIYFNGEIRGALVMNDMAEWVQRDGIPLPDEIIETIGNKIEDHYA